jgi:D-amino-acid dehydrogenase
LKVLVLGAGVVGTTSAWYLARAGHQVTVVDRQPVPGNETSFANGGQISVSHAEPWANPHVLPRVLKWLGKEDAPLLWRWRADPAQLAWGLRFLAECLPGRTRRNIASIVSMSLYSRSRLRRSAG